MKRVLLSPINAAIILVVLIFPVIATAQPMTFLPFAEGLRIHIVQGNNGRYSHSGNLRYAYDIDMGTPINSSRNPIYGKPIYAPFTGVVHEIRQGVRDFSNNNASNTANNGGLGNTVLLRVTGNDGKTYYFRFAHMQYNSIPSSLRVGSTVQQGALIGRVGQTGYSSSPHLHMHMSSTPYGSSLPFTFVEGPAPTGTFLTSALRRNTFIVDNTGKATIGFPLSAISASVVSGSWASYSPRTGSMGNYRGSTSVGASFRWRFRYTAPRLTNTRFRVYARCPALSSRDNNAQYTIRYGTKSLIQYINQRTSNEPRPLAIIQIGGGTTAVETTVRRSNSTVCADALIFQTI